MEDYSIVKTAVEGEVIPQGVSKNETDVSVYWHIKYGNQAFYVRFRKDGSLPPCFQISRWTKSDMNFPSNPVEDGWLIDINQVHELLLEKETQEKTVTNG